MKKLSEQIAELENYIPDLEKRNDRVSKVNVAWQIDHSIRVVNGIIKALEQSNPADFKVKFNFWRSLFLTLSYLPRGKGRAPKKVLPDEQVSSEDIIRRLSYAKQNLEKISNLNPNSHFPHPVFGSLNRDQANTFIRIHTEHHLKIIRDILKS